MFSVAFSTDGQTLASGVNDDLLKLWAVSMGILLQTMDGHELWVYGLAFSPDGQLLASGAGDESITLWSVAEGRPVTTLKGHTFVLS